LETFLSGRLPPLPELRGMLRGCSAGLGDHVDLSTLSAPIFPWVFARVPLAYLCEARHAGRSDLTSAGPTAIRIELRILLSAPWSGPKRNPLERARTELELAPGSLVRSAPQPRRVVDRVGA